MMLAIGLSYIAFIILSLLCSIGSGRLCFHFL
jgi:hypothetical protein